MNETSKSNHLGVINDSNNYQFGQTDLSINIFADKICKKGT